VHPRFSELTRTLRNLTDNRPIMYFLTQAMRSTGELSFVAALIECWMSAVQGAQLDLTLLKVYVATAVEQSADSVRALAHAVTSTKACSTGLSALPITANLAPGLAGMTEVSFRDHVAPRAGYRVRSWPPRRRE